MVSTIKTTLSPISFTTYPGSQTYSGTTYTSTPTVSNASNALTGVDSNTYATVTAPAITPSGHPYGTLEVPLVYEFNKNNIPDDITKVEIKLKIRIDDDTLDSVSEWWASQGHDDGLTDIYYPTITLYNPDNSSEAIFYGDSISSSEVQTITLSSTTDMVNDLINLNNILSSSNWVMTFSWTAFSSFNATVYVYGVEFNCYHLNTNIDSVTYLPSDIISYNDYSDSISRTEGTITNKANGLTNISSTTYATVQYSHVTEGTNLTNGCIYVYFNSNSNMQALMQTKTLRKITVKLKIASNFTSSYSSSVGCYAWDSLIGEDILDSPSDIQTFEYTITDYDTIINIQRAIADVRNTNIQIAYLYIHDGGSSSIQNLYYIYGGELILEYEDRFINKINYQGDTLIDLTLGNITPADVLSGRIFHSPTGRILTGTAADAWIEHTGVKGFYSNSRGITFHDIPNPFPHEFMVVSNNNSCFLYVDNDGQVYGFIKNGSNIISGIITDLTIYDYRPSWGFICNNSSYYIFSNTSNYTLYYR